MWGKVYRVHLLPHFLPYHKNMGKECLLGFFHPNSIFLLHRQFSSLFTSSVFFCLLPLIQSPLIGLLVLEGH